MASRQKYMRRDPAGSKTRRSLLGFESLTNYVMTSALLLLTN